MGGAFFFPTESLSATPGVEDLRRTGPPTTTAPRSGGVFVTPADRAARISAYAKAAEAADRALALSPELAAAHLARGYLLHTADLDWLGAEAEYRRALELAPNDGEVKFFLGGGLATVGELESAIELTQQALTTEPLRATWYNYLALYLSGLNRVDEAERAVRRAIELQPGAAWYHQTLTVIEVQRGDAQAALRTLIANDASLSAYQIAQTYALRNDAKATIEWLERAWNNRDPGMEMLLYDHLILRYKGDPRFAAFCRKVGLPTPAEVESRK